MNTIPCPDCGKAISPQAKTCPNCGRPIQTGDANRGLQGRRSNQQGCLIVLLILVGLVIGCVIWSYTFHGNMKYRDGYYYKDEK